MPGNPLEDITVTESVRFVMKAGQVFYHDETRSRGQTHEAVDGEGAAVA